MTRPPPSLTVVIAACNAARFVGEALSSLAGQHRRDLEIVVVDDGSTDDTAAIVEAAAAAREPGDPPIRLIRQANAGPSAARNRGIEAARSPLVGFLDADDAWLPDKVARHLRLMETHPEVDLSFSGYRFVDEDGADLVDWFHPDATPVDHEKLLRNNIIHTSTVIARTEALRRAGGFDEGLRYYEDYDLWLRVACLRRHNVLGIRDSLTLYRRHPSQATANWRGMHEGWREVVARAAARDPDAWRRVRRVSAGSHLQYGAALAYNAGEVREARRLMLRAWREGGPRMAADPITRIMSAILLTSLLPKPLAKPLGSGYLRFKSARGRLEDMREASRRLRTTAPFNAVDGLWREHERTTATAFHDAAWSWGRRLVRERGEAWPFRDLPDTPDTAEAAALADACRKILKENLSPFFLRCADPRNGGYLENADDHGFYDRGDKWLIKQARNLWTFTEMARHGYEREAALELAETGYAFLQAHFLDREHGGYRDRVRSDGSPLIDVKLLRHQSHAILALAGYAQLTGSGEAREAAVAAFHALDDNARDEQEGGYFDCLRADWSRARPAETAPHQTVDGARHLDAEMHLVEALTRLHRVAPGLRVRLRLVEHVLRCLNRFRHPRAPGIVFHHDLATDLPVRDYRVNLHATYGHDLELIWLVFDALEELGIGRHAVGTWARQVAEFVLRDGFDARRGGFYGEGRFSGIHFGMTGRDKIWWVQADGMVSMLELYATTGRVRYFEAFRRTLGFVQSHMLAPGGGWYRTVHRDGRVKMPVRAAANQGPYHSVRSMIRCSAILDGLAAEAAASGSGAPERCSEPEDLVAKRMAHEEDSAQPRRSCDDAAGQQDREVGEPG